jgi:hypothetical protein
VRDRKPLVIVHFSYNFGMYLLIFHQLARIWEEIPFDLVALLLGNCRLSRFWLVGIVAIDEKNITPQLLHSWIGRN